MTEAVAGLDPQPLELIWSRLLRLANEQQDALRHTAFSPIVPQRNEACAASGVAI